MLKLHSKKLALYLASILFILTAFVVSNHVITNVQAETSLASRLSGKILLQVEDNGEAWYLNPQDNKRSYLGRPHDAFAIMREEGIGITNDNLFKIPLSLDNLSGKDTDSDKLPDNFEIAIGTNPESSDTDSDGYDDYVEVLNNNSPRGDNAKRQTIDKSFAKSHQGKIFIQVEGNGEAWYVDTTENKRHYLGRPSDAFSIMRHLGLGITNTNLNQITIREGKGIQEYDYEEEEIDNSDKGEKNSENKEEYKNHITVTTHKPELMREFSNIINVSATINDSSGYDFKEKGFLFDYTINKDEVLTPTLAKHKEKLIDNTPGLNITAEIDNLLPKSYPYIRAYVITSEDVVYYEETEVLIMGNTETIDSIGAPGTPPMFGGGGGGGSVSRPDPEPVYYDLTYTASDGGYLATSTEGEINELSSFEKRVKEGNSGDIIYAIPDTGYRFTSWSDDSTDNPRTDENVTSDMSVTANFEINDYKVTFNANGGTGSDYTQTITFNASSTLTANTFIRTGYTFTGWATTTDGVVAYTNGSSFTMDVVGITLYAQWSANDYEVTFNANGGDGAMDNQTITFNTSANLTNNSFTRANYTFTGWNTESNGSGTSYTDGSSFTMDVEGITLYAQWSANDYEVTFNANGGDGAMDNQTITFNTSANLTTNSFTRANYTFTGWNTESNGSGTSYTDGSSFTMDVEGITLYAQWSANDYEVTFNANGGDGAMDNQTITFNTSANLTNNSFTREGYNFTGWATTTDGVVAYTNGSSFTMDVEGITLYAQWSANDYEVTFNANGGTGSDYTQTITFNASSTLTANTFIRTGYTFTGWATTTDGVVAYTNGSSFTMDVVGITLYAQWSANDYEVTFNANGGDGAMDNQTITFNTSANLTNNSFTRANYTFTGWNTESNGSGTSYTDGSSFTMDVEGITLYAQWSANDYEVTFNANGGDGAMDNQTITFNTSANLTTNSFTRANYTFTGWNTESNGSGTSYTDGSSFTMDVEGITLYAQWSANDYEVTFNANGGDGAMDNQTITFNTSANLTNNSFTREGYNFTGWATTTDGVVAYTNGSSFTMDVVGITLYAQWTANNYDIIFNDNGGTGSMVNQTITFNTSANLTNNSFTREGYNFTGWATTTDGVVAYTNGSSFTMDVEGITLYAQWSANDYEVTFNANGGDGAMDNQTITFNTSANLTNNSFTRANYTFTGWNTESNGSGTSYTDGSSFTMDVEGITLYAQWSANDYEVTFNANGGDGAMDNQTITFNTSANLTTNSFTRANYTFTGWNTESNGSGTSYTDGSSFTMDVEGITLYAQWSANDYEVTFNANGGDGAMDNQTITFNTSANLTNNSFTREGYNFTGWATTTDGVVAYTNGSSFTMDVVGITLYAQWTANNYDIIFNDNGGTGSMVNQTITFNTSANLTNNSFTREGYNFTGWATTTDGVVAYTNGSSFTMDVEGITLYAQWSANDYEVTFNANGGDGAMDNQTITFNTSANLTNNSFTRANYTFTGWNTESNGSGTSYTDGSSFTMDVEGITLYAQWSANDYEVTFNANGGDGAMDNQTITFNTSANLTTNSFTRANYTFTGWNTESNGSGTSYTDGSSFTMDVEGITLYAQWSANDYEVTFNANGGDGAMDNQTITFNTSANLTNNSFTREGYNFTGWATTTDGVVAYTNGSSFTMDVVGITLYAQWTANNYDIIFNDNGGTGSMVNQTITFNTSANLTNNSFTREGYNFTGWATTTDGVVAYTNGSSFTMDVEGITLYAQWSANDYEVTFNANGGDGAMDNQTITFNTSANLTNNSFTRANYTFTGWNTESNGSGTSYTDGSSFTMDVEGITLYAQWSANDYEVTFNANGGDGAMDNQTITFNTSANLTTNSFTRANYTFTGWNTESNGSGTSYTDGSSFTMDVEGITLYAQWSANDYEVTFNANGGDGAMDNQTITFNTSANLTNNSFTREGYNFTGWATTTDGVVAYTNGSSFTMDVVGITLYAQWTANNYDIIFNDNGGTGSMVNQTITFNTSANLTNNSFTREGYNFTGWATTTDGVVAYTNGSSFTMDVEGITLYAQWSANDYEVTFNANGGDGAMDNQTITFNTSANLTNNSFTRANYTFTGWNTESNGSGTSYTDGSSFTMDVEGITLYAQWSANDYEVTFNANGGDGAMDNQTITFNTSANLTTNSFTRANYTFTGWNTESNGSGTSYTDGSSFTMDVVGITLYAQWTANNYDIIFNDNGGTGSMVNQTITFNTSANLTNNSFTREGYNFTGWATTTDGVVAYTDGSSFTMDVEGITLYAQWTINDYKVTFNANGGTGSMDNQTITFNTSANLTNNSFTREGYNFTGWATTTDGVVAYTDGSSFTMDVEGITLYAQWTINDYKVTFNANGGTGSMANQTITFNTSANLTNNSFTRTGYTFTGWATTTDGVVAYTDGSSFTMDIEGITLYAQWTINDYKVTFNANGGTGSDYTQTITFNTSANLTNNSFTREGYNFTGWATTTDGVVAYTDGSSFTMDVEGITLYAQWTINDYKVTFNANGGTGSMDNQTITFNTSANLTNNSFTREGYNFTGWATTTDGVVAYTDGSSFTMDVEGITLYAQWTINDYKVTFNANGGTGSMANQTITFNTSANLTNNSFTRTGYTFTGWATTTDGVVAYTDGSSFTMDIEGITLYAQWTINDYKVTFNDNGGTGSMDNQTITFNTSANLTTNTFSREGYDFTGWNTESDGSGTSYTDEASFTMDVEGITLYAQWEMDCGDDVTFTYNGEVVTYGVVGNPDTGMCWLDRNLGATQVATALDDPLSYGDLFQWGRGDDGHQERTSNATSTLSSTDDPGHSNFITPLSSPFDWRSPQNDNLWQGETGINNPCPTGFRLPTIDELETEMNSWSSENSSGAFNSPLKWSVAGSRISNGSFSDVGSSGYIWSSSVSGSLSSRLHFRSSGAGIYSGYFLAYGYSVRCLRSNDNNSNDYDVVFDANGGTGTMDNQTITFNTSANLTTNTFTRANYTFTGWNTESNGSGTSYSDGASFTLDVEGITLYAQWEMDCGDDVTFTYNGEEVTYGVVGNPDTGMCWLDRNLGATQVATALDDPLSYGDLFQWGRGDDGHQERTSNTTSTSSSGDVPGNSNFITNTSSPYDWRSPQNDNLWQGETGINNPCPTGFRLPTRDELTAERLSWSSSDSSGAFNSPLKWSVAGFRTYGSLNDVGSNGTIWSSSVSGSDSSYLYFRSSGADIYSFYRAYGHSVRCLRD